MKKLREDKILKTYDSIMHTIINDNLTFEEAYKLSEALFLAFAKVISDIEKGANNGKTKNK